jgi:hypothetical protein
MVKKYTVGSVYKENMAKTTVSDITPSLIKDNLGEYKGYIFEKSITIFFFRENMGEEQILKGLQNFFIKIVYELQTLRGQILNI